jgi:hypothetical protein
MADDMSDPGARKTMLGIADTYERMLKHAGREVAEKRPLGAEDHERDRMPASR